jgi:GH18 family chitinase
MKGFDIINLEKYVEWFNIMTYDIRKITFIFPTTNATVAGSLYDTGLRRFCMYVYRRI